MPTELTEAAKVDGATESQVFWKITLPQIAPTIGVVVTALFVTVMKVFDIVYAMTNGNFGTQVIANQMWITAFGQSNLGLGSALAVVLFVSVIPVMWINIRRMQRDASVRGDDELRSRQPRPTHQGSGRSALSLPPLDPDVGAVAARGGLEHPDRRPAGQLVPHP